MKTSTVAFAVFMAASRVHCALEPPTNVYPRGDESGTKVVARQEKKATQKPSTVPVPGSPTSQGCYTSAGNMTLHKPLPNMSSGSCYNACKGDGFWVSGLHGQDCYCGFAYPPIDAIAKDQNCDYPCPAYPLEVCGGLPKAGFSSGLWSVFNIGINVAVQPYEDASSTSSTASRPTDPTNPDDPASVPATATPTQPSSPSSGSDADKKSSPNTAGIAAGSVVGVVVAAAIIGGIFFYMRRKRNAEIEEEHRRNAAVSAFINGSKPPGSSGSISMTDARLDPVMANRRMSDGSIADNEDYSRRILRVTNA